MTIATERLVLRIPVEDDRPALRALLADPVVMRDLVRETSPAVADASIDRHFDYRARLGLGFWVVEAAGEVAGFCGLKPGAPNTPIADELEIGWIFGTPHWGKGYAVEAARASLDWAWRNRPEDRVVAITAADHVRSQRVMARLGMVHLPDKDFDHPLFAPDDPMRATVTFAADRPETARG